MEMQNRRAPQVLDVQRTPKRIVVMVPVEGARVRVTSSSEERGCRLESAKQLGRFRILEQIGEGGMGRIYAAWDTRLDRRVALKVLVGVAEDEARRSRLETEARALASLAHPNVVTYVDFCLVDGDAFIVMEYLDGTTLRDLVDRAPLPLPTCRDVGTQIADGLAAIHRAAILHRDLKPENIQVLSCGRVKILDLGLSVRCDSTDELGDERLRRGRAGALNGLSGTVPYMAPEQLRGDSANYRSDIYAFGVIMHEMLTGALPVTGCALGDAADSSLGEIVRRCLRARPEERYANASKLASAFAAAAPGK